MNNFCPCGSRKSYHQCCEPVHLNHAFALSPEQLMRARYSAHVLKQIDFVVNTYHSSCNAQEQREGIEESIHLNWSRLEVIRADKPLSKEGFVEFKAYFSEGGIEQCMHECSRFVRENGLWYYIDGFFPENGNTQDIADKPFTTGKVGRNDPCPCGSGKKHKKCCG